MKHTNQWRRNENTYTGFYFALSVYAPTKMAERAYTIPQWIKEYSMKGDLYDFLVDLGHRESNNNYEVKNDWGFVGRWQFGKPRLYDMGVSLDGWHPKDQPQKRNISWLEFKKDSLMQSMVVLKHVRDLKHYFLRKPRDFKIGEKVNGVEITLSGCVAAAHLKGIGGLRELLEGRDNEDALGTKASTYMREFGGYNLVE